MGYPAPRVNHSCLIVVDSKQPPRARGAIRNSAIKVGTFCWVLWLDSSALDMARARYRVLCGVKIPEHPIGVAKVLRKACEEEIGINLDSLRYEIKKPLARRNESVPTDSSKQESSMFC
ncbi:MAG: hypothetical protein COA70_13875 [Planctomycetota bacterium]|nr:MAG: hypothetical protein COA70_13875 [Planctomycetota bacterium]